MRLFDSSGHLSSELIDAFALEGIPASDKALICAHIAKCKKCAASFLQALAYHEPIEAPASLTESILSHLKAVEALRRRQLLILAFLVGIAVGVWIYLAMPAVYIAASNLSDSIRASMDAFLSAFNAFIDKIKGISLSRDMFKR